MKEQSIQEILLFLLVIFVFLVFLFCKLFFVTEVQNWSWWTVTSPLWLYFLIKGISID
jgi:hypothetical protein